MRLTALTTGGALLLLLELSSIWNLIDFRKPSGAPLTFAAAEEGSTSITPMGEIDGPLGLYLGGGPSGSVRQSRL